MSDIPPNEPSIAGAGADPGGRKAAAHEARGAPQCCAGGTAGQRGGRRSRAKGNRIEREIVQRHFALGIQSERYPLSGASYFRGHGHDIDLCIFGQDEESLFVEVKSRKSGNGYATIENWLADCDVLMQRRNNADPLVCVPWRVWARLLERVRR
jgi:hypothetical protein